VKAPRWPRTGRSARARGPILKGEALQSFTLRSGWFSGKTRTSMR
jgi:hypothetical protein